MTPERLAEIERRSNEAMQAYRTGTTGTPPNIDGLTVNEALDTIAESAKDVPGLIAAYIIERADPDAGDD